MIKDGQKEYQWQPRSRAIRELGGILKLEHLPGQRRAQREVKSLGTGFLCPSMDW